MMHTGSLEGRRALVTGAASGIGLAIARELAREGARVLMSDVSETALAEVARDVRGARTMVANLASREDVKRLAAEAGEIDVLVNSAGLQNVSPVDEFDEAKWDLLLEVMLTAPFLLIRSLIPGMYARSWGRVFNVGSVHSLVASPYKSAYVSAKHGLVGLTKVVALEAAETGITCNAICPGYVWTPLVEAQIADQAKAHGIAREAVIRDVLLAQQPNKRFAQVEEIGSLVAFLAGEGGASITGTALPVDGGWTAH